MFIVRAVKARNCGGLILFDKRNISTSSRRNRNYIVEFSFYFSISADDKTEELIKNNLFIRRSTFEIIFPFHIERKASPNTNGSVIQVLFEIIDQTYNLYWKCTDVGNITERELCCFIIDFGERVYEEYKNLPSLEHSLEKLFQLFEYPHLISYSWWRGEITMARCLRIIMQSEDLYVRKKFISSLAAYDIEKNLETFPAIESWIDSLIEIFTKNRNNYDQEIYNLSNDFLKKLKYATTFSTSGIDDVLNYSGFLAMCRIAFNGNVYARELCLIFLQKAIGKSSDYIISHIASTFFSFYANISIIIFDYLKDLSLLEQNLKIENFEYYDKIFANINKLKTSETEYFFKLPYYSNSYVHYDLENEFPYMKEDCTSGKLGSKIPNEIFRIASIQAKGGNIKCIELFKFILKNMEESTEQALIWTALSLTDLCQLFKVRQYLMEKFNHSASSCWIARKYIIGIPEIVESNSIYGYALLKKLYIDTKCEYASKSLGQLYFGNVKGFPKDLERVIFWFSKLSNTDYQQTSFEIKTIYGISISHDESYFFDNNYNPKKSFFAWLFNK